MKNHLETLSKEYKEINLRMNQILLEHNLDSEDLGNLPSKALREFSELNRRLFEINDEMIEAFKKDQNASGPSTMEAPSNNPEKSDPSVNGQTLSQSS
jgi:hypothetical protein